MTFSGHHKYDAYKSLQANIEKHLNDSYNIALQTCKSGFIKSFEYSQSTYDILTKLKEELLGREFNVKLSTNRDTIYININW